MPVKSTSHLKAGVQRTALYPPFFKISPQQTTVIADHFVDSYYCIKKPGKTVYKWDYNKQLHLLLTLFAKKPKNPV